MRRIWHPWTAWECVGMYTHDSPLNADESKAAYAQFLADLPRFSGALDRVLREWPISCQHFLTNQEINRIAWLGQASMFIATGVPAHFRAGFKLLSLPQQRAANATAAEALNRWTDGERKRASQDRRVHTDMGAQGLLFGHPRRSATPNRAAESSAVIPCDLHGNFAQRSRPAIARVYAPGKPVVQRAQAH